MNADKALSLQLALEHLLHSLVVTDGDVAEPILHAMEDQVEVALHVLRVNLSGI